MTTSSSSTAAAPAAVVKAAKPSKKVVSAASAAPAAAPAPSATPKPKRAVTSFINFSQKNRAEIKAANPNAKFTEVAKLLAAKWNSLSDKQKEQYGSAAKLVEAAQKDLK